MVPDPTSGIVYYYGRCRGDCFRYLGPAQIINSPVSRTSYYPDFMYLQLTSRRDSSLLTPRLWRLTNPVDLSRLFLPHNTSFQTQLG